MNHVNRNCQEQENSEGRLNAFVAGSKVESTRIPQETGMTIAKRDVIESYLHSQLSRGATRWRIPKVDRLRGKWLLHPTSSRQA